jgi:hypothetical protein
MAAAADTLHLADRVVATMAEGVDQAVECWMAEIEAALTDVRLTTLGRTHAVREVLERYKRITGKAHLRSR